MDFHAFMYVTIGRRHELEAGQAGLRPDLYQRTLDEIAEYVRFADQAGFAGFGHPEHHLWFWDNGRSPSARTTRSS